MELLKSKLIQNPKKQLVVGLRTTTPKELVEIKKWMLERSIQFKHITNNSKGKLPYNGILLINSR